MKPNDALERYVANANKELRLAETSYLEHAVEAGRWLLKARRVVQEERSENWASWLRRRISKGEIIVSYTTASNYLMVAANWNKVKDLPNLSINKAIRKIRGPIKVQRGMGSLVKVFRMILRKWTPEQRQALVAKEVMLWDAMEDLQIRLKAA
jgi:hypothetical protein